MIYKEEYADVTTKMPEYVTAHCISEDCAMGAGVVLAFRKTFPGLKAACMEYMEMVRNSVSPYADHENRNSFVTSDYTVYPYRHVDAGKTVYNMFTKKNYWHKAGKGISYEDYMKHLKESLEMVKKSMIVKSEKKLAMPRIGSGLDRCKWEDVKETILEVFKDTDFEVLICEFK